MKPQGLVTMKFNITLGQCTSLILKEVNSQKAERRVMEHLCILHRTSPPTKGLINTTKGADQRIKVIVTIEAHTQSDLCIACIIEMTQTITPKTASFS
jgi:hypothetical protein